MQKWIQLLTWKQSKLLQKWFVLSKCFLWFPVKVQCVGVKWNLLVTFQNCNQTDKTPLTPQRRLLKTQNTPQPLLRAGVWFVCSGQGHKSTIPIFSWLFTYENTLLFIIFNFCQWFPLTLDPPSHWTFKPSRDPSDGSCSLSEGPHPPCWEPQPTPNYSYPQSSWFTELFPFESSKLN